MFRELFLVGISQVEHSWVLGWPWPCQEFQRNIRLQVSVHETRLFVSLFQVVTSYFEYFVCFFFFFFRILYFLQERWRQEVVKLEINPEIYCDRCLQIILVVIFLQMFLDTDLSEETTEVKPLKWEEDMQLFSRFLDRKVGVTILVRLYVTKLWWERKRLTTY